MKILILTGCNNNSYYLIKKDFEFSISRLDNSLVNHFPTGSELGEYNLSTSFLGNDSIGLCSTCFSASSLMLYKTFSQKALDSIYNLSRTSSIIHYSSMDTAMLSLSSYNDRL